LFFVNELGDFIDWEFFRTDFVNPEVTNANSGSSPKSSPKRGENGEVGGAIGGQIGGAIGGPIGGPIGLTDRQKEVW